MNHPWYVRMLYICPYTDMLKYVLTILMSHRESYRVITVIRVNCTSNVVTVAVCVCMSQGWCL